MAEKKIKAKARIRVIIEIDCPSWWDENATVDEVFRRAGIESLDGLQAILAEGRQYGSFRIIGDPAVEAVLTEYV
jgi:hypothetical protein